MGQDVVDEAATGCPACDGCPPAPWCWLCCRAPEPPAPAPAPELRSTRWAATVTTFGPTTKVIATLVSTWIVLGFAWVPDQVAPLRWVTIPVGATLEWIMLRSLWHAERAPVPDGGRQR